MHRKDPMEGRGCVGLEQARPTVARASSQALAVLPAVSFPTQSYWAEKVPANAQYCCASVTTSLALGCTWMKPSSTFRCFQVAFRGWCKLSYHEHEADDVWMGNDNRLHAGMAARPRALQGQDQ